MQYHPSHPSSSAPLPPHPTPIQFLLHSPPLSVKWFLSLFFVCMCVSLCLCMCVSVCLCACKHIFFLSLMFWAAGAGHRPAHRERRRASTHSVVLKKCMYQWACLCMCVGVCACMCVAECTSVKSKRQRSSSQFDSDRQTDGRTGMCVCVRVDMGVRMCVCVGLQERPSATIPAGKRQFSLESLSQHQLLSMYVCVHVCVRLHNWLFAYLNMTRKQEGRHMPSRATDRVTPVCALCNLQNVLLMRSYGSFPVCVCVAGSDSKSVVLFVHVCLVQVFVTCPFCVFLCEHGFLSECVGVCRGWLQCVLRVVHQGKAICLWTAPSGEIYHHCTWPLIIAMDSLPLKVCACVVGCVCVCVFSPTPTSSPQSASLLKCCREKQPLEFFFFWLHPQQLQIRDPLDEREGLFREGRRGDFDLFSSFFS